MKRTLFGQEVVLCDAAAPGEIIMHMDTWAAIENQGIEVQCVVVKNLGDNPPDLTREDFPGV